MGNKADDQWDLSACRTNPVVSFIVPEFGRYFACNCHYWAVGSGRNPRGNHRQFEESLDTAFVRSVSVANGCFFRAQDRIVTFFSSASCHCGRNNQRKVRLKQALCHFRVVSNSQTSTYRYFFRTAKYQ